MNPLINIGTKAALEAGKFILRAQEEVENLDIIAKGKNDFATQVDKTAEEIIISHIHKAYPRHKILAEESGLSDKVEKSDTLWIIDPLDGTTNFVHGFPQFCISIGIKQNDKIMHGIVYDPIRDELFTATRGAGARLNDKRLRVSKADKLDHALLGTGFPFREFSNLEKYLELFKELMPNCVGIRRAGAAALDLAYVAAGRLDGFWELGLKPWDIAAGSLLIQEAGGYIADINGKENFLQTGNILAANPKLFPQLEEVVTKHLK